MNNKKILNDIMKETSELMKMFDDNSTIELAYKLNEKLNLIKRMIPKEYFYAVKIFPDYLTKTIRIIEGI